MSTWDLICASALLLPACSVAAVRPSAAKLPRDVYIIAARDMAVWCQLGWCEDFRTPPASTVADFEKRLPSLLEALGHDDLAAKVPNSYVRQYWAVAGKNGHEVVGNFVCRAYAVYSPSIFSDLEPSPPEQLARVPIVIDDAGICLISVTFPAGRPDTAKFSVR